MDLNSIISALTGNNLIGEIAKKFNIDTNKIINVIKEAIPKFLSAMQKNAGTAAGAAALTQALGNHAGQGFGINLEDGQKILQKILLNKNYLMMIFFLHRSEDQHCQRSGQQHFGLYRPEPALRFGQGCRHRQHRQHPGRSAGRRYRWLQQRL